MTTETILWPARRTRVIPAKQYENPWFRSGWRAREERALLATLRPLADRQEEDEDYDVIAPLRPKRSWTEPDVSILNTESWYDPSLLEKMGAEPTPEERKAKREAANMYQVVFWTLSLEDEDVWTTCLELDTRMQRGVQGDHWDFPNRWVVVGGQRIRTHLLAWLIEFGDLTAATMLKRTCVYKECVNPEHHVEVW
jgi:hypothetical protein